MSNLTAIRARTWDNHVLRLFAALLLGFSLGVDVTRWFPQAAFRLGSPAIYISLVLLLVAGWWQKQPGKALVR
jgi:hypothetical protein